MSGLRLFRDRAIVGLAALTAGCAQSGSQFEIVNYRDGAGAERFVETFDEAYYDVDRAGNVDIVLRRETPGTAAGGGNILQLVHVRTFWRCIPGTTVAHATQINGTITYGILNGAAGATFEGAGSVFANLGGAGESLVGTLDLARLRPVRQLVKDSALFEKVELSGQFEAKHDPKRTINLINELERTFAATGVRK